MFDLSILVPIYKVEKYIRPCFESIFQQGLSDDRYEIIVVNDGTPDRSMEVVADLLEEHDNITIINQKNQGLSVARNVALARAAGKYVLMLDSDDLLIEGSLSLILEKAINSEVDVVMADFLKMSDEELSMPFHIPFQDDIEWKEKTGKQFFLEELNPKECYVWRSLFRRSFLQEKHLLFVPGIYYQDVPFTHESYLLASKCLRTNKLMVIHRKWDGSVQSRFTLRHARDFSIAIGKTWELRKLRESGPEEIKKLQDDLFVSFHNIIRNTLRDIHGFSNRMRVMNHLSENAPNLRFTNGKAQQFISLLYSISPHLLIIIWSLRQKTHHHA
ncbi:MAG: glycosyltransferase [Bacteroidaceae bacterium]|nr:glycosyltransferase [Bacteroidaceae bacterium]